MNDDMKEQFSRRKFLGVSSAALAAGAGTLLAGSATAQEASKARTDRRATDPGPANKPLDAQNLDSEWPPSTDSKSLVPTFKYPFSLANKRT
ncbi:MAG TPA: twin-arginine translocation signal domain-containing protein, partial [Candidatus Angelobacter sp.]